MGSPPKGEELNEQESELISEFISDAQMKLMQLETQKEILELQAEIPDALRVSESVLRFPKISQEDEEKGVEAATRLLGEGRSPMDVSAELGLPLPLVLGVSEKLKE